MWAEVNLVIKENRPDLCLDGPDIQKRITENGLDPNIFQLVNLKLLRINEVKLNAIPPEISNLTNLGMLTLYGNELKCIPRGIEKLEKLVWLDLSGNKIVQIPEFINSLTHLATLDLSGNKIIKIPSIGKLQKLTILDLSFNCLEEFITLAQDNLLKLSSLKLQFNQINSIPGNLQNLSNLKQIILKSNKIICVPKNVANLQKLKDIDLSDNPLYDKRLLNLVNQCRSEQVLDYIKIYGTVSELSKEMEALTLGIPETNTKSVDVSENKNKIFIKKYTPESIQVTAQQIVSDIRPHILCLIITNVRFNSESFKKFLQVQCKLHDTVCGRREKATIATHDLQKMKGPALRNYSAIDRYIYSWKDQTLFICKCLQDAEHTVISLHPLTKSDMSKITEETTQIFLEVTSSTSMTCCSTTMEKVISEILLNKDNQHKIEAHNVEIVNEKGDIKTVYPSKSELMSMHQATEWLISKGFFENSHYCGRADYV